MKCVIIAGGAIADYDVTKQYIDNGDYIIAADSGLRHTEPLGVTCDELLGDFDSLGYIPDNATEVYPCEKDDTDTMLAVKHGLLKGMDRFVILGGLGGRLDHTFANIAALEYLRTHGASGLLADENTTVRVIGAGQQVVPLLGEGYFSVFPYGGGSVVVSMSGVQYPAERLRLHSYFPMGVSNRVTDQAAFAMTVHEGMALVVECRMG